MRHITLCIVTAIVVAVSAATAEAQFQNTPFDPTTWVPTRPDESTSTIQVVTSPFIDAHGNIWSGSGSGGGSGHNVGRANTHVDSRGRGWWTSSYGNIYGRVQARRAPHLDHQDWTPSGRYYSAFTLVNRTPATFRFALRINNSGQWTQQVLAPGQQQTFRIHDLSDAYPRVQFDTSLASGLQLGNQMLRYGNVDSQSNVRTGTVYVFENGYGDSISLRHVR